MNLGVSNASSVFVRHHFFLAFCFIVSLLLPVGADSAWYDSDYGYCRKLTMTAGGGSGGVATTTTSGFPLVATTTLSTLAATSSAGRIEKTSNGLPVDLVMVAGTDCNSDSGAVLDYYVEDYNSATGAITLWVQANDISSTTAKSVLMYYGNSSASDLSDEAGVWDAQSEYAVWNLSEGDSTAADFYKNSVSDNFHGTLSDSDGDWTSESGKVGTALRTNPDAGDGIALGTAFQITPPYTFMAWINPDSFSDYGALLSKRDSTGAANMVIDFGVTLAGQGSDLYVYEGVNLKKSDDTPPAGTWTHVMFKQITDGGHIQLYVNGVDVDTLGSVTLGTDTGAETQIGASRTTGSFDDHFDGFLDDLRFYNRYLTDGDLITIYNNTNDSSTFWTFGAEETAADATEPTVSITAPSADETVSGSAVSLAANASDDIAVAGVSFYVDGTLQGSEDTSSPYGITWDSTATSSGSHTVFAVARDTSNNYATSTSVSFSVDNTAPVISAISVATTTSTTTITWTTDEAASTKVNFGLTSSYGAATTETDTSPRVTSHSAAITTMAACTQYHYQVYSADGQGNVATSSDATVTTGGCSSNATVTASGQQSVTTAAGGTLTQGTLTLTVPTSFATSSSSAVFQANELSSSSFFSGVTGPSGKTAVGSTVFNLKALTDATTTLSNFASAITVTMSYTAAQVESVDESSLVIYRYDGSNWSELSSCSVDTGAKTVSCTTTAFSDFALFGTESSGSSSSTGGGVIVGFLGTNTILETLSYIAPRQQIVYPDGRVVYIDQKETIATSIVITPESKITYSFDRTLRKGMSGEDVQELQRFLNENGFIVANGGPGSPGKETNFFGRLTHSAVIRLQNAFAKTILYPLDLVHGTGIFGPSTRTFIQTYLLEK